MSDVVLRRHDGAAVAADAALRERVAAVYAEAFGQPPYRGTPQQARRWASEGLLRHAGYPGFSLVVAERDGGLLGFAYGLLGADDQWFTRTVRERVPAEVAQGWVGGHGELVEIAVRPSAHGQGVGGLLHDAAVADLVATGASTALLSVDVGAPAARGLYAARGWRDLADLAPQTRLMGLRLATPSAAGFGESDGR